jgi:hypothetical protein
MRKYSTLGFRLVCSEFSFRIPVRAGDFSLLPNVQNGCVVHPGIYSIGTFFLFGGVTAAGA